MHSLIFNVLLQVKQATDYPIGIYLFVIFLSIMFACFVALVVYLIVQIISPKNRKEQFRSEAEKKRYNRIRRVMRYMILFD